MFARESYDVIVVGAGPAGCAASSVAARAGLAVLHVERDQTPRFKIGESLMPQTYWAFERMGVLDQMKSSHFVRKYSVQFYARSGRASSPFYFREEKDHECSQTWQVLRSEFDQVLFQSSARQGAECHRGVTVEEILFDGERATGVRVLQPDGQSRELRSRVLIDATGQSTMLARKLNLGKVDYDLRNMAVFSHFKGARRDPGIDEGATLVLKTCPDGDAWFWYIPLADDKVSVGVVGPIDYLKREGNLPHETFFEEVEKCPEIKERISHGILCRPMQVLRDFSYRHKRMTGDGWILIGDAFTFIDPIYSSGVLLGMQAGILAADAAALACRTGDVSGETLGRFEPLLSKGVRSILGLVKAYYCREFSFGDFLRRHPQHRSAITLILTGDVFERDFDPLFRDLAPLLEPAAKRSVTA